MMGEESFLFESLSDLFDGFKKIRLSSARSADYGRAFDRISRQAGTVRLEVQNRVFEQFIFGQVVFFALLAVVVFAIPLYASRFRCDIVKMATAVMFMIGPIGALIQSLGILAASNAVAERMLRLEADLAAIEDVTETVSPCALPLPFSEIRLSKIVYTYRETDGPGFAVGPIDIAVRQGEVIFVTGGNGSGKSTLMKVLTGLYRPDRGSLTVDGEEIGPSLLRAYRGMIAAVFSDFHIFPRLYGAAKTDMAEAKRLLTWMEMDGITDLRGDRFRHIDLSSGQRKRLALIVALLERRPVLVLDEWAADQDPQFRRRFYREMLPEFKRRGLTVIAVTHDDAYFDAADRRFHLEEGLLRKIPAPAEEA